MSKIEMPQIFFGVGEFQTWARTFLTCTEWHTTFEIDSSSNQNSQWKLAPLQTCHSQQKNMLQSDHHIINYSHRSNSLSFFLVIFHIIFL